MWKEYIVAAACVGAASANPTPIAARSNTNGINFNSSGIPPVRTHHCPSKPR